MRQKGQSGIAVIARQVRFREGKIGVGPGRFETRSLAQLAQLGLVLVGLESTNVMLESIEAQRALGFREFGEGKSIGMIISGEQSPNYFSVKFHQGFERAAFAYHGKQAEGIDAQDTGLDDERFAVGSKRD